VREVIASAARDINKAVKPSDVNTYMCNRVTSVVRILATIPAFFLAAHTQAQLPAFPGADGAAAYVTGGRGGIVYHVTRLDTNFSDVYPGGLRYGLDDANFPGGAPRTIVFDVGGVF
jgi:hypothetical protein